MQVSGCDSQRTVTQRLHQQVNSRTMFETVASVGVAQPVSGSMGIDASPRCRRFNQSVDGVSVKPIVEAGQEHSIAVLTPGECLKFCPKLLIN